MAGIINTASPSVTGYSATQQSPAVTASATGYDPTKQAPAVNADISQRVVDPSTQTVAGQVQGIINQNSPLLQQSVARSQQKMNDRGLGNSSMAINAGESALYDAAVPIATADANVYGNAANLNTTAQNTANLANAGAANTVNANNTQATNAAKQFGAASTNQANIYNAGAANTVNATNAQASNIADQFTASAANTQSANELSANTQKSIASLQSDTQQSIASLQSETQKIMNDANLSQADKNAKLSALTQSNIADAANKISLANTKTTTDAQQAIALANNASAQIVAGISATSQQKIAALDNDNKILIQTDASAATLHANAMQSIANIEGSANISDKAGAVQQIIDSLNNGLSTIGVIGHSLDFQPTNTSQTPAQQPVVPEVGAPVYRPGDLPTFENPFR